MRTHSKPVLGAVICVAVVTAIAASVFLPSTPAHAAATGSFQKSCTTIEDDGVTISASCKKKNGSTNGTALAYTICQGDIRNDDGTLKCTAKGSFKNSCNSISWNSSFLMANCRKKDKSYIWNSGFSYSECINNGQDIANCDGSLQCGC